MKVIFCDCDGVIVWNGHPNGIDPAKVEILKRILVETNARIILSSSWRFGEGWRERMFNAGLPFGSFSMARARVCCI